MRQVVGVKRTSVILLCLMGCGTISSTPLPDRRRWSTLVELEGTLDLFSLRELIEMSVYSSVTGVLKLASEGGQGQIFFRDGVAYHCAYCSTSGEAALVTLFEEQQASFVFAANDVVDTVT